MIAPPPRQGASTAQRGMSQAWFARAALAIVLLVLLIDAPRLQAEVRFFQAGSLIAPDGNAPVLQDDASSPDVDAAFAAAAAHLPADATCVIARHAWHRDYFRAAYLLMPRRIWPAVDAPAAPINEEILVAALRTHRAACLLIPPDLRAPTGYHRITMGAYMLFTRS